MGNVLRRKGKVEKSSSDTTQGHSKGCIHGIANVAVNKTKELVTKGLKKELKSMVKTLGWPVAFYGCKTWMMK
jgi:hypothetical protein